MCHCKLGKWLDNSYSPAALSWEFGGGVGMCEIRKCRRRLGLYLECLHPSHLPVIFLCHKIPFPDFCLPSPITQGQAYDLEHECAWKIQTWQASALHVGASKIQEQEQLPRSARTCPCEVCNQLCRLHFARQLTGCVVPPFQTRRVDWDDPKHPGAHVAPLSTSDWLGKAWDPWLQLVNVGIRGRTQSNTRILSAAGEIPVHCEKVP